ncbi:hypothetical protein COU77_02550 [Candidatus Peregrinibacteria bacterium CG10_big_fil_rev_8_21_14_0_10_49_16]|nr:MAG: hypothetical protein COU77_02550 [Candidatus Peregrinibacteria bacterium CG10_big_fil_rev_8_21_14_0_10_49_16]
MKSSYIFFIGFVCAFSFSVAYTAHAATRDALRDGLGSVQGFTELREGSCFGPAGDYCDEGEGLLDKVAKNIRSLIVTIATGIAVCVLIFAGIQMITAQGNEEKLSKSRKLFIITLVGVIFVLAVNGLLEGACRIMTEGGAKWFSGVSAAVCSF